MFFFQPIRSALLFNKCVINLFAGLVKLPTLNSLNQLYFSLFFVNLFYFFPIPNIKLSLKCPSLIINLFIHAVSILDTLNTEQGKLLKWIWVDLVMVVGLAYLILDKISVNCFDSLHMYNSSIWDLASWHAQLHLYGCFSGTPLWV